VASRFTSTLGPAVSGLSEQARAQAEAGLSGALKVAGELGGARGAQLAEAAKGAYVDGMASAAIVGTLVVVIAAVAAWFLLPHGDQPVAASAVDRPGDESAAGDVVDDKVLSPSPVVD
jgi:hypothetical protein